MDNTGRISRPILKQAQEILFRQSWEKAFEELGLIAQVDYAHLIMLYEMGIIRKNQVATILRAIKELNDSDFEPLREEKASRGLYLLYEDYLIGKTGQDCGGMLQTARSRNDLNATVLRMRLRKPYETLLRELLRLQAVILRRARRYARTVMPIYTHYQAAVPGTYGHYLAGVVLEVSKHIDGLLQLRNLLNQSPLGAGAIGGTTVKIDSARTAALLGFDKTVNNSISAIASRDYILYLLSLISIIGIMMSRVSADLLLWTTNEFSFLELPDELVGSSSAMPQKRNPFLLEHVQGKSALLLGHFTSSATAMHGKPFTNSIAVNTEAVAPVWSALEMVTEVVVLLRLVIGGAKPKPEPMLRQTINGYTTATEIAIRLVLQAGWNFRAAHHKVGELVLEAQWRGEPLEETVRRWTEAAEINIDLDGLDPSSIVQATVNGGGPSEGSLSKNLAECGAEWKRQAQVLKQQVGKWGTARRTLQEEVDRLISSTMASGSAQEPMTPSARDSPEQDG